MTAGNKDRLYNIKNDGDYFFPGRSHDGNQFLIGAQYPEIIAVEFDKQGTFSRVLSTTIPQPPLSIVDGIYQCDRNILMSLIEQVQDSMDIVPGSIAVKMFFLTDRWIGIKDMPDYYQEIFDRLKDDSNEIPEEIREDIDFWNMQGYFVLSWSEDYYLNSEGEVIDS